MLSARNLACRRGGRLLFRDRSLTVKPGALWLVSGPNGSGKSSLLRILAGLLRPQAGEVAWDDTPIAAAPETFRAAMLYVGHRDAAKPVLTAAETLAYWLALRGEAPAPEVGAARIDAALTAFGLAACRDLPTRRLSEGQRRRLSLARLALFPARLWLLDEPGTALDRQGLALLRARLEAHAAAGGLAVIASHEDLGFAPTQRLEMEGA